MTDSILRQIADGIIAGIHRGDISVVSVADIRSAIDENPIVEMARLDEMKRQKLEHIIGSEVVIIEEKGSVISKDAEPWLKGDREAEIDWDYWERFRKHLQVNSGFPHNVLNRLHEDTSNILDLCGDPEVEGDWKRSGLVVGHVQSGKTTNYSGVIAKGIDAGYKIFILFAGITNSLRAQTQERIEESIVGLSTRTDSAIGVGRIRDLPRPTMWTTIGRDFNINTARSIRSDLNDGSVHVFVLKKNKSTIESLLRWLASSHPGQQLTSPLMLIDDEADNASINTSKDSDRMTAINRGIRSILERFNRAVYVGYTATPFANIFINHENDEEMMAAERVGDDLFPRNFIKSLGAPENYVGAARLFGDPEDRSTLCHTVYDIDDYEDILWLKHKRTDLPEILPPSLHHAIRMFVLFCAVQKVRGKWGKHMTMMINVSRFNDIQAEVENQVTEYLEHLLNSASVGAGLGKAGLSDSNLSDLESSYNNGFLENEQAYRDTAECSDIEFVRDIMPELHQVLRAIIPKTINMKSGPLDYSDGDAQKVIAIGGLALSRGLTLEGLAVSYILRNASASDTLMQMARWFGYRMGHENLVRLYLPEASRNHYEGVHKSIEELRDELHVMEILKKSPLDFGLRVRNSDTGIRITAANKSRAAVPISFAPNFEFKHVQGYLLDSNEDVRSRNWDKTQSFLSELGGAFKEKSSPGAFALWRCSGGSVLDLVRSFDFPDDDRDLGCRWSKNSALYEYIAERVSIELSEWDVVLPLSGSIPTETSLPSLKQPINLAARHSCIAKGGGLFKTTVKDAVANPGDVVLGLNKSEWEKKCEDEKGRGYRGFVNRVTSEIRVRPLMLIHLLDCKPRTRDGKTEDISGLGGSALPFASLSFLLPGTSVLSTPHSYTANSVLQRFGIIEAEEDDDYAAIVNEGS